jgi:hypothetical protein
MEISYELIVSALLVLIVVLVVSLVALTRYSVGNATHSYPPEVVTFVQLLVNAGAELARRTATPVDDRAIEMLASILGAEFKIERVKPPTAKPDEPPPPATPEPAAQG